jgi:hypothetical protein
MDYRQSSGGSNDERTAPAAYLPFKTFLGSFDVFDHGIPHRIDRSMWKNLSGVAQSQILMAFRFFNLIGEGDEPKPALNRFVENKERRKEYVGALLQYAYSTIIDHDLTKMTPKMLSDELESYRVSGETKRKAIAFFLQAARFAELPMHPLLASQTRAASTGPRKKRKASTGAFAKGQSNEPSPTTQAEAPQSDSKRVQLKSGAVITLTISANWLELGSDERKFVFDLIDLLQSPSAPTLKSDKAAP